MVRLCPMLPAGMVLAGALLLAACGAPAATPPSAPAAAETAATQEAGTQEADTEMMTDTASTVAAEAAVEPTTPPDEMAGEMAGEMTSDMTSEPMTGDMASEMASERPAWQSLPLTEARTGTPFTLADFAGKTVFVEPFATWCTNCRQNLANVHAARQQAGEDVIFVALSIEPNIGSEALAAYAKDTGYDLMFAAMPPEMLQALAAQFGQTIANPPATPHFVIRPDGATSDLVTGIRSTPEILAQVGVQG